MEYRSVADLDEAVRRLAADLPSDVDLVVGVPRSGLLAGNLLALHLNAGLTDVDGLRDRRLLDTGPRYEGVDGVESADRVVVVDDSVHSGAQMRSVRATVDSFDADVDVEYAAVYVTPRNRDVVDYCGELLGEERIFEWNALHHGRLEDVCVDVDGVLCRDPTPEENDGTNDRVFPETVEPDVVPSKAVGWLVTSRPETDRKETERWLDEHGIEYGALVTMDPPDDETGRERRNHAAFKAEVYESTDANLFVEGSARQAEEIAERTGRRVLCWEENRMVDPSTASAARNGTRRRVAAVPGYARRFAADPIGFGGRVVEHVRERASGAASRWQILLQNLRRRAE